MKGLSFFSKTQVGLGVDLGSEWLKVLKISVRGSQVRLEHLARAPWSPGELDTPGTAGAKVAALLQHLEIKDQVVVSSVAGHSVIVKRVMCEAESPKLLGEVVHRDARQYIPFDITDVFLDYQYLSPGTKEKTHEVLLVASKKKAVQGLGETMTQAGLSLSVVDVDAFAVCNAFEFNYPEFKTKPAYLLDIGGTQSVLCVLMGFEPVFLREVGFGGRSLSEAIAKRQGISRSEAERLKLHGIDGGTAADKEAVAQVVRQTISGWCDEVKRLIGFYESSTPEAVVAEQLFLSGGGALLPGIADAFAAEMGVSVELLDPFRRVDVPESRFQPAFVRAVAPQFVVPFGLSLRGIA
ncbi:MAG: type pilus assembly protein PilM [Desulfomicrobiaceae bacterium]|nr:type pilus assembly protein PilM [Desulfomicrobiaceae bacterium]